MRKKPKLIMHKKHRKNVIAPPTTSRPIKRFEIPKQRMTKLKFPKEDELDVPEEFTSLDRNTQEEWIEDDEKYFNVDKQDYEEEESRIKNAPPDVSIVLDPKMHKDKYHLSWSALRSKIVSNEKGVLRDNSGRLYYEMKNNKSRLIKEQLGDNVSLFTIVLSQKLPGPFAKSARNEILDYDQALDFPEIESEVTLYNYYSSSENPQVYTSIQILEYPEKIGLGTKTTSAICRIFQ
jgi:hypothetical protein